MASKYLDNAGLTYFWGKLKAYFQPKLVSGTNIKTINNQSLLGSGNITIEGGGSGTSTQTIGPLKFTVRNGVVTAYTTLVVVDSINGSAYKVLGTLQSEFRPTETFHAPIRTKSDGTGLGMVRIQPNGEVGVACSGNYSVSNQFIFGSFSYIADGNA